MKKILKGLDTFLMTVIVIVLIALMLHTVTNALGRYFFKMPIEGTNEVAAYWYLPVITLAGFVIAHLRREHISVSLLTDKLRVQNKKEYLIFNRVLGVLLSLALTWYGLLEAISNFQIGMTAGVSSVPIWPVTFLVPVVFAVLAAIFAVEIYLAARGDHDSLRNIRAENEAIPGK